MTHTPDRLLRARKLLASRLADADDELERVKYDRDCLRDAVDGQLADAFVREARDTIENTPTAHRSLWRTGQMSYDGLYLVRIPKREPHAILRLGPGHLTHGVEWLRLSDLDGPTRGHASGITDAKVKALPLLRSCWETLMHIAEYAQDPGQAKAATAVLALGRANEIAAAYPEVTK